MTQIALFLVSVFGVTWALCLVLRPVAETGGLPVLLGWLFPTVWTPTIAALILVFWSQGVAGVKRELQRLRYPRGAGRWLLLGAALPAASVAIAVGIARRAGDAAPFTPSAAIPLTILLQLLTGAVGEELGWRGFLLPRLGERFGPRAAAWGMATLWSSWHIAGFFFPGTPQHMMPPLLNLLFIVFFGVFLAGIFYRTGGSVLATMLAHLSLNIGLAMGGVRLSSLWLWWTLVAVFGAVAVAITIASRTAQPATARKV